MLLVGLFIVLPVTAAIWLFMRMRGIQPRFSFQELHDRVGDVVIFSWLGLVFFFLAGCAVVGVIWQIGSLLGLFGPLP
jgi:hypothetical protein